MRKEKEDSYYAIHKKRYVDLIYIYVHIYCCIGQDLVEYYAQRPLTWIGTMVHENLMRANRDLHIKKGSRFLNLFVFAP